MDYEYLRTQPLNDDEQRRQLDNVAVFSRFTGAGDIPHSSKLVDRLVQFLNDPALSQHPLLVQWLLVNGSPTLNYRLIQISRQIHSYNSTLIALRQCDPDFILPSEHLYPDMQVVTMARPVRSTLVCFAGNAQKLNIPIQLAHLLAVRHFDQIIYLRDRRRQRFTQGLPGLVDTMSGLNDYVGAKIPSGALVSVIATSSGCAAALNYAETKGADRLALFSPAYEFKGIVGSGSTVTMRHEDVRMYFALRGRMDGRLATHWGTTHYAPSIRKLDSDSHGTLNFFVKRGGINALFRWLRGDDHEPEQALMPDVFDLILAPGTRSEQN